MDGHYLAPLGSNRPAEKAGHYKGHLAVIVQTEKGPVVLAGDAIYLHSNLKMQWPVGLIRTTLTDAMDVFPMVKRVIRNGGFVVPGHDVTLMQQYPEIQPGIARIA